MRSVGHTEYLMVHQDSHTFVLPLATHFEIIFLLKRKIGKYSYFLHYNLLATHVLWRGRTKLSVEEILHASGKALINFLHSIIYYYALWRLYGTDLRSLIGIQFRLKWLITHAHTYTHTHTHTQIFTSVK